MSAIQVSHSFRSQFPLTNHKGCIDAHADAPSKEAYVQLLTLTHVVSNYGAVLNSALTGVIRLRCYGVLRFVPVHITQHT